ncbi:HAD-like domain-containing protein [Phakopsora pachyrhizi]|uniref:HAD-like domain-containing protein n=1 Tax=Phakopsora pachyrhizi TaxID=170000 RepID=A0AAV0BST2_PHAPC|nr:HAD-like domain-containing protein [Phakopsora pachyrhizi]
MRSENENRQTITSQDQHNHQQSEELIVESSKRLKLDNLMNHDQLTTNIPPAQSGSSSNNTDESIRLDRTTINVEEGDDDLEEEQEEGRGAPEEGDDEPEDSVRSKELIFNWKDSTIIVPIDSIETIGELKVMIYSLTAVPPERQKILGLVAGKLPTDEVSISSIDFKLKRGSHFKLLGSPEEDSIFRSPDVLPSKSDGVENDGQEISSSGSNKRSSNSLVAKDCVLFVSRVQEKLNQISSCLEINIMNPPRQGKKLLVLDLDYTLMDSKAYSDYSVHALGQQKKKRKNSSLFLSFSFSKKRLDQAFIESDLHEFLTALWPYYDFCIWSATNWRWLESKLVELGMVGGRYTDKYLIQFVLDRDQMFEVTSMRHGKVSQHEVKALELIWRKISNYNATNTVHLDDLSRNFVLNPTSGVKISAFKNARENKHDRQLVFLARYFLQLSTISDVRTIDHKRWADCELKIPNGVLDPLEILDENDPELIRFKNDRNRSSSSGSHKGNHGHQHKGKNHGHRHHKNR